MTISKLRYARKPVGFRKGAEGLAALECEKMGIDPFSSDGAIPARQVVTEAFSRSKGLAWRRRYRRGKKPAAEITKAGCAN